MKYSPGSVVDPVSGFALKISPFQALKTANVSRLVGGCFVGATINAAMWTATTAGGGAASQTGGLLTISPSTGASGTSKVVSRRARFMSCIANAFHGVIYISDSGVANNKRRWGAGDANDGVFFEIRGSSFGVMVRKNGSDTFTSSAAWTARPGYALNTSIHFYEINYSPAFAYFYIDGELVHVYQATTGVMIQTPNLPITLESVNSAELSTDAPLYALGVSIERLGPEESRPIWTYLSTAATTVIKRTPGTLHSVVIGTKGTGGATITLYDDVSATPGLEIVTLDIVNQIGAVEVGVDFQTGLTAVTGSGIANATVVWD